MMGPISHLGHTMWCCRFIDRKNGGPMDHFRAFTHLNRLNKSDWGVYSYENYMRELEALGCQDRVNQCNLRGVEIGLRQCQFVEYVYALDRDTDNSAGPSGKDDAADAEAGGQKKKGRGRNRAAPVKFAFVDEAAVFTGSSHDRGTDMISPQLLEFVAKGDRAGRLCPEASPQGA